ncbi:MAG: hypothetical protein AB2792_22170 [Candidatus Thiodiazotropha sp.]
MFYTKQDFATAAIDAVEAFNRGDIKEAMDAHDRMDEMLRVAFNKRISVPSWKELDAAVSDLEKLNLRQAG